MEIRRRVKNGCQNLCVVKKHRWWCAVVAQIRLFFTVITWDFSAVSHGLSHDKLGDCSILESWSLHRSKKIMT